MTSGVDKEGGADALSGSAAGGTGRTSSDEDAGPSAKKYQDNAIYAAMLASIDESVGRVRAELTSMAA